MFGVIIDVICGKSEHVVVEEHEASLIEKLEESGALFYVAPKLAVADDVE